jgi:hypothetical protein
MNQAVSIDLEPLRRLPDAAGGVRSDDRDDRRADQRGDAVFRATGRKLVFDGFMKVAGVSSEDQLLPGSGENKPVFPIEIVPPAFHAAAAAVHRSERW